ncbi:Diacylglycerol kinase theta [Nibea albiflora]|uniref:Diacylglycerol kinase theta n=1 Tax=Nibea albiflora TaxID=240163 RepID=A0ACB7ER95_NIBAL|nr:Diacylglycerol kinase theta [Nibea albiflora]
MTRSCQLSLPGIEPVVSVPLTRLSSRLSSVCNFMCHEKCLKTLRSVCSCMSPSLIRVMCELHVHADCAAFSCADCRTSHLDVTLEQVGYVPPPLEEGNLASAARCEVCRRSCGSSDVMAGMRCEWLRHYGKNQVNLRGSTHLSSCPGIIDSLIIDQLVLAVSSDMSLPVSSLQSHAACTSACHQSALWDRSALHAAASGLRPASTPENFSKMHCYRITESCRP